MVEDQTGLGGPSVAPSADPTSRWGLERAEIQAEVDTLVHQLFAGLLKAADELKERIRKDTDSLLENNRQIRAELMREIEAARAELDQTRAMSRSAAEAEMQQERERILAEARGQANDIIRAAEVERDRLLGEIRATEGRLRALEIQIQQALGAATGASATTAATASFAAPPPSSAPPAADEFSPLEPTPAKSEPPAPAPPAVDEPAAAEPVSAEPAAPAMPTAPREVQLVFTSVPGYQQAAALERAARGLPNVGTVDVLEFERGRLVLQLHTTNDSALPDDLIARAPLTLQVVGRDRDQVTFQVV